MLPNERVLCQSLGVSRTALREAINGLAAKGLLDARRKRGTLVLDRTCWNMLDADLICWTRHSGRGSVSKELWEAVSASLPAVARMAACCRGGPSLLHTAKAIDAEPVTPDALCGFLIELAHAAANPFLCAVVCVGMRNLLVDDPAFLRGIARPGAAAQLRHLAEAVWAADGLAAERHARQFCDFKEIAVGVA